MKRIITLKTEQNFFPGLFSRENIRCFLLIFLCFLLTSAGYLSWLYHLIPFVGTETADLLTMGGGYLLQAAGIGLLAFLLFRHPRFVTRRTFYLLLLLYTVCMIPALLGGSAAGTIVFGLLMNLFCGLIAAFYLHILTNTADPRYRAVLFGAGYAAASIGAWLLSLPDHGSFLQSRGVLIVYFAIVIAAALPFSRRFSSVLPSESTISDAYAKHRPLSVKTKQFLLLACGTVFLFSLIKNIGFGFPSSDTLSGVSVEASRIFYGAGLLVAGFITDHNRKYGAVCTLAALITPFLVLSLSGEPLPQIIFWALDYFIFAFFSVYRVLLLSDLALSDHLPFVSGFGLLFGRLGDIAGTLICTLLNGHTAVLVTLGALLFVGAIFLFFRLYQILYMPNPEKQHSEQELFAQFCSRYALSAREQEVLRLLLDKSSSAEIAEALFISDRTVKFHIHNLLTKTGCKNRAGLLEKYRVERD